MAVLLVAVPKPIPGSADAAFGNALEAQRAFQQRDPGQGVLNRTDHRK
jgi:hypothetical protein